MGSCQTKNDEKGNKKVGPWCWDSKHIAKQPTFWIVIVLSVGIVAALGYFLWTRHKKKMASGGTYYSGGDFPDLTAYGDYASSSWK